MGIYLNILTTWVLTIMLVILTTQQVRSTEINDTTTNLLSNGSFDDQTTGWELDGNVAYDGNNYGEINKSVRFSGSDGGSITQSIQLDNIAEESKEVTSISGSLISIGCNNEGSNWCTQTGTENNLDPVNITMTLSDGTNSEVLTHNFTSDYNDGVITTNYSVDVTNSFETANTSLTVNYAGLDTGNKAGQFGTIIDDLSLSLTLSDVIIPTEPEIPEISPIVAPEAIPSPIVDDIVVNPVVIEPIVVDPVIIEPVAIEIAPIEPVVAEPVVIEAVQIGSLDATSIVNTISSGVIDINPTQDMQIASLSPQLSVTSDLRAEQMNIELADVGVNNEMPTLVDTGAEVPVETDMPEIEMPDLTDMPEIEMPEVEMPSDLPEVNDIQIESVSEPEPETLKEIREELPTEVEEINMEDDLKENQNEQQEETPAENDESVGENEEGELSSDSQAEEKESEAKEEVAENDEKESDEEESNENDLKDEPVKNEENTVKTAKTEKSEKKDSPDSPKSENKKTSKAVATPKVKSDIVVQELDLPTIISFNKEYFANTYKDTIDLTQSEMEFYGQDGFNSKDYTQASADFFNQYSNANSEWDMVSKRDVIKIEQFRR